MVSRPMQMTNQSDQQVPEDLDPRETQEWLDALDSMIEREGVERAHYILERLISRARRSGGHLPYRATTAYLNTIPPGREQKSPGDHAIEWRIRSLVRWNAMAMVVRANLTSTELGGHIASFASSATLYEVGFNHFFHAPDDTHGGDLLFVQGHSAPGIYARAYLAGRISEEQMANFRREVGGKGLSSYPHPWLMPDYWQFPTVSMGLGPIMAIYQARFMRYLESRGLSRDTGRKVWAFMGDGEMDEPESLGAIGLAAREKLDNLIFVINCNLQRLDGPVRGNYKIIQELEGTFRGAGWNVIKLIWGSYWDPLIARDTSGLLQQRMEECVDGDYQTYKARDGAYVRDHFFGKYPQLREMVSNMSDEDLWRLNRGGHDPHKVYAAYAAAVAHKGQPTVILAKTVKGYGMGDAGEGKNITHQQKKMGEDALRAFRDRFSIPVSDEELANAAFYRPPDDSPELRYLRSCRKRLGGYFFVPRVPAKKLELPETLKEESFLSGSGGKEISTTMAFVRILNSLMKDPRIGRHIVPIIPDEARTFGMEGMFRQYGIYSSVGQLYDPADSDQLMYYREDKQGQILEEGINEAGAYSSWIAAATAFRNHNIQMIPFYIFYSMFGFQRVGDLAWASGDMRSRGFLIGGTSGRTTLAGEGLQHQDGHSHLYAATIPNCVSYDPAFAGELVTIIQSGMRRMFQQDEDVFYYITVMNENYSHPALPEGAVDGIVRGMYRFASAGNEKLRVRLLGSGSILREIIAAAELLREFDVGAEIWSVTSFNELCREGLDVHRWNMRHPQEPTRKCYVEQQLPEPEIPVIAATDYMKAYADQIRNYIVAPYTVLGTDGFGRSDNRVQLRRHFEVDRGTIAIAALHSLMGQGQIDIEPLKRAQALFGMDPDKPNPAFA